MIKRYVFGKPIETDAVLNKPEISKGTESFFVENGKKLSFTMEENTIVYGLGENVRGINKRGWIYESNCADEPTHLESTKSLYGAHNFLILSGEANLGLFLDTPGKVTFDIGYTHYDTLEIIPESTDYEIYLIENSSPDLIVKEFRTLIGQSYIPPRWAFGYGQSRWGYQCAEDILEVVENYRENKIPLDSVYLDIDYMERFKDFTINREAFPDFPKFVEKMKENKIHLVPIIDAGVKIEAGYDVYEEGKEKGYFCKDENGEDFVVGVWPGKCCFPDMLNEEAGKWFGNKYKLLLEQGIDGFWNDMNEPAIFYSEKNLKKVFEQIQAYQNQNLDIKSFFEFRELLFHISNNEEDYASFYHNYKGQKICHKDVHNLFGYYMTRIAGEAFERLCPDKRILMFSRASYIGMHRYGGIWQGDNMSWWSHLLMNIKMMPSLNMCGFLYTGADIGGFGADTTEDLLIRWLSFAVFTPLMRNHSAMGTRMQEAYRFDNSAMFRDVIGVRYRLIPYLYSEYMKAALNNSMMFRPLGFVFEKDELARRVEDQLLVGESIMIAPVYEQNAVGRNVYFPEPMKVVRFHKGEVQEEGILEKGYHYIKMPLGDICIFIRSNQILPLAKGGQNVSEISTQKLQLIACGEKPQAYVLYEDDGETKDYSLEKHLHSLQIG